MNELKNKILNLKLKKAMLLSDIESLSEVGESIFIRLKKEIIFSDIESFLEVQEKFFTQLGKVVAEISKAEKQLVRATENLID